MNPKVFEFAKQIGMETLSLMDMLKTWNIPVKNHMAELDTDTLELIKSKLEESKAAKTSTKKKKTAAKKKVAKKAATAKTEGAAKKVAAPKAGTKARRSVGKVIRRKASEVAAAQAKAEEESIAAQQPEETKASEAVVDSPAPVASETPVAAAGVAPSPASPSAAAVAPSAEAATMSTTDENRTPTRSLKKEVIPGTGKAPASSPSNIIGRIDLNRTRAMERPRSQTGSAGAGAGGGAPGGRNVRPGFFSSPQTAAPFPPATEVGRRDDRRKKGGYKGPGAEEGGAAKEEEVETFDASEFRKRELVFQPKKKKASLSRPSLKTEITVPKASKRVVKVYETIKVADFAREMGVKAAQIISTLMKSGVMATPNDSIDFETAALIAPDFKHEVENVKKTEGQVQTEVAFGDLEASPIERAPVVTVMGHVDHGKTSLLDVIRQAKVAEGEAGGITQHIGAYKVTTESGHSVTFIDTPGHEAFTAMRARGANVTDIVVLVVAADDGVMKQTIEAISHAKSAGVPIIVAVNKMDKPSANPDRIKQQLTEYELVAEEWGGQTPFIPVSALKRTGVKELLEQIHLQAEVMELKANPLRSATGVVVESRLERGRGVVASLLVKDGTIRVGQSICAGTSWGKVRALYNDLGKNIKEAGPSDAVEVIGLNEAPLAGDTFDVCKDEAAAETLSNTRKEELEITKESPKSKMSLEELFSKVQMGDVKELPVVLKSDVIGSQEALRSMLEKASTEKVKIKIIHAAVGGITESDVLLAASCKGLIVGFNVRPEPSAVNIAKSQAVDLKLYSVIYEVVDDIKKAMAGLLSPTIVENTLGRAEVRNTFNIPKIGTIAGCSVQDGKILRSAFARLVRDGRVIYDGKISSLKRFKDDAKEVATGYECGISIENYNDIKVGDVIEAYEKESVAAEL